MSETEWFSAGLRPRNVYSDEPYSEVLVRAWEPGDGMLCHASSHNKRISCGEPVAVVKMARLNKDRTGRWDRIVYTRVACIRHLAKFFDGEVSPTVDVELERQSLEELAQRYWDQYQKIRERRLGELLEKRYAALPNGLRERVIALSSESGDGDAA